MITSVSYRKSGSPQPEAYNSSGTFVRYTKSNSAEPSSPIPSTSSSSPVSQPYQIPSSSTSHPEPKSRGSFWHNLFRPAKPDPTPSLIACKSKTENENLSRTLERSRSSETVNSICSTNSFSFVKSPSKYKGRKKGKRIPLPEDSLSRPPHPNARRKISTLTRLGMKIGLKSKYNLQSCESLHRLNVAEPNVSSSPNTLNRSLTRKRRAPLPPGGISCRFSTGSAYCESTAQTQILPSTSAQAQIQPSTSAHAQGLPSTSVQAYGRYAHAQEKSHRRCFSEGENFNFSGYLSPKSRYHVRGKRKAPPPPNPFGDPDAPETIYDVPRLIKLSSVPENEEMNKKVERRISAEPSGCKVVKGVHSPRNSYVEKEVQSDNLYSNSPTSDSLLNHEKAVNDQVKAQLAILKHEAEISPLRAVKPVQSPQKSKSGLDIALPPKGKSPTIEQSPQTVEMESPTKIAPRPWYKRSSSKSSESSSKTPSKKNTKPTVMLMAKFSDLDREASRIVEENRRRSAEISYNESAKELITMFNEFSVNQKTASPSTSNGESSPSKNATKPNFVNNAATQISTTAGVPSRGLGNPGHSTSSDAQKVQEILDSQIANSNNPATGRVPVSEEPKKLAVVQPQSNPRNLSAATVASTSTISANSTAAILARSIDNRISTAISTGIGITAPATTTPLQMSLPFRPPENQEEWSCPRCTLKNDYWRSFCDACHYRNCTGSTVQSISSLFENVNRQIETRPNEISVIKTTPANSGRQDGLPPKPPLPLDMTGSNRKKKPTSVPSCENFLSQLPLKEKLSKEEKLMGMKLHSDPEIEELDIAKLREARVAFFERSRFSSQEEMKPNNLAYSSAEPSKNGNKVLGNAENPNVFADPDDEALDALLEIHQQLNPNMSGSGPQTWKPLNVQKFRPMLESIVETSNDHYAGFHPVYENLNLNFNNAGRGESPTNETSTNMFMQNVQMQLKDHIRYFEQLNLRESTPEENDTLQQALQGESSMDGRKRQLTLEEYQKLGAIPKYFQNGKDNYENPGAGSSRRGSEENNMRVGMEFESPHSSRMDSNSLKRTAKSVYAENTFAISKLLRDLEWAIAQGDHRLAASLAHDLALFKVNCVVSKATQQIVIRVYVEDRLMQQGPFQVQITPSTTVKELKAKIECDWGIPIDFQKWILGRKIAEDDNQSLSFYEIANDSMAFLYLVTPGSENENMSDVERNPETGSLTRAPVPNTRAKLGSPAKQTSDEKMQKLDTQAAKVQQTIAQQRPAASMKETTPKPELGTKDQFRNFDQDKFKQNVECVNPKRQHAAELISKPPKPRAKEPIEKKIDNEIPHQSRNAHIRSGPPAESISGILQPLPQPQKALKKSVPSEFIVMQKQSENLKSVPLVQAAEIAQMSQSKNVADLNAILKSDIVNNNLSTSQIQTRNHIDSLQISKASKIKDNPRRGQASDLDPSKTQNSDTPSANNSIEKVPRRKHFVKVKARKVDQGTSIERNAPICTVKTNETLPHELCPLKEAEKPKKLFPPQVLIKVEPGLASVSPMPKPLTTIHKDSDDVPRLVLKSPVVSNVTPKYSPPLNLDKNETSAANSPPPLKPKISPVVPPGARDLNNAAVIPRAAAGLNQITRNEVDPGKTAILPRKSSPSGELEETRNPVTILKGIGHATVVQAKDFEFQNSSAVRKESRTPELISRTSPSQLQLTPEEPAPPLLPRNPSPQLATPKEKLNLNAEAKPYSEAILNVQVNQTFEPITSKPSLISSPTPAVNSTKTPGAGAIPKNLISNLPQNSGNGPEIQIAQKVTNLQSSNLMNQQEPPRKPAFLPNLKRNPPVSKPFVRKFGSIFISSLVGNLVAAAEDMNKKSNLDSTAGLSNSNSFRRKSTGTFLQSQMPETSEKKNEVLSRRSSDVVAGNSLSAIGKTKAVDKVDDNFQTYKRMIQMMQNEDFIKTVEEVDCPICLSSIPAGEGITLRDCLHSFCKECLVGAVQYSEEPQVRCPFRDNTYSCDSYLQEREVKGLVPPDLYDRHLARSVKLAESKMSNAFHCKTNDCTGWCVFEDDVNVFNCPVCRKRNCLTCQAIHEGHDCQEHQRLLAIAAETDEDAKSSRIMLEKMISRGEALDCPACHVVLLKKWGCDWVRCSYCKTEICWVTKGFRWGPNGKGDTSGGCKCGINGVRCHPKCTYCH